MCHKNILKIYFNKIDSTSQHDHLKYHREYFKFF